ncbi:MAG: hypothetical protein IT427_17385 [Pirellulales bacterium]|nr:hypothetical protein [Pirellulales bacterium]
MVTDFRRYDDQGFPVPPRFEDLKYFDDEPGRRPKVSLKAKRWLLIAVLVAVVIPAVFGRDILNFGRSKLAEWLSAQAFQKYYAGDLDGALAGLNQAIEWSPSDWKLYFYRALWREKGNDLDASLADFSKSIELLSNNKISKVRRRMPLLLSKTYSMRAWVYVRLGRQAEAMSDANRSVQYVRDAENLNARAYARAILGIELEAGLADVETALKLDGDRPNMIDTRGYLLHLLDRDKEALEEMGRAIEITENDKRNLMRQQFRAANGRVFLLRELQELDESLAVMYHHRQLIYRKLGQDSEADQDFRRAEQLGYDPAKGVL